MKAINRIAILLGPALGIIIPLLIEMPGYMHADVMLGVVLWMATWWLTGCVPLAVTALIPLIVFPVTGIASAKDTAPRYMTSIMFLFVGGFLIAQAMERCGLHKRIALVILSRLHKSPIQILLGFSLTTAFLSMWISNTATTMLMVTIAVAVISRLDELFDQETMLIMASTLLLAIAYSANIGGMGTPVGTVPNLVFLENIHIATPGLVPSFLQWMMVGVPMVIVGISIVVLIMSKRLKGMPWSEQAMEGIHEERKLLGKMGGDERFVTLILGGTALAWMTRKGIQGNGIDIPGWSSLLPYSGVDDGTVAMFSALLLFLIPVCNGKPILGHNAIGRLQWEIIILLGGGFVLAMGMKSSGLSQWVGEQLQFLSAIPLPLMLLGIAFVITFLTEVTSNTATTQVMLPVLAAVALVGNQDTTQLLLVATLAASCAFMLPVATPPNAIIFGTDRIEMNAMIIAGIRMNLIMPLVILAAVLVLRPLMP